MTLHYEQPADDWTRALPLGNGHLGAMVWGGARTERIDLNEGTLWSGDGRASAPAPPPGALAQVRCLLARGRWHDAQTLMEAHFTGHPPEAFQPLGTLRVGRLDAPEGPAGAGYRRSLSLRDALHTVTRPGEQRECFVSHPDRVLTLRWQADREAVWRVALSTPHPGAVTQTGTATGIRMTGRGPLTVHPQPAYAPGRGVGFHVSLRVVEGEVTADRGGLRVRGHALTLLLSASTSFRAWNLPPDDPDAGARCEAWLDAAQALGYAALRGRHAADVSAFMDRVTLNLGPDRHAAQPTDRRLAAVRAGGDDPGLHALHVQYGRYLLLSASRPGGQPANLQGLWNPHVEPPWCSDYTLNINAPMNYWPAEVAALPECAAPLHALTADLAASGEGVARDWYGARGWAAHHNTDLWRMATPTDGSAAWACWPLGGAWLALHAWDAYRFRPGRDALERAWALLEGSARFLLDWLVEGPDGAPGTAPSTSPENTFLDGSGRVCGVGASSSLDLDLIREVCGAARSAARLLDVSDTDLLARLDGVLARLPRPQPGRLGARREWAHDPPPAEPGHRHLSHLFALFPGTLIPEDDHAGRAACRAALDDRLAHGSGHTGWSAAWIAALCARLGDGAGLHAALTRVLTQSTHDSLLGDHPPFQIDTNFGAAAALLEGLLHSHLDAPDAAFLRLLPALPAAWPDGSVRGLRARGGLRVDLAWAAGALTRVTLRRKSGDGTQPTDVHYLGQHVRVTVPAGQTLTLGPTLSPLCAPVRGLTLEIP
ncbi:glycoside hydrolase family 95 protein [Deinococcus knuensis]|uniref:Alpha/beta hydrolase n=1 Tax=Deinococcus knuensis TaxID=1837380 RepID=A0ABQ2SEC1_9DEIO|nr:glycoside hydrolase family 95 protein [Deinococcus knuensis]GGS25241.1 alpha/beta hydrolase [Deinococcus knuensis]